MSYMADVNLITVVRRMITIAFRNWARISGPFVVETALTWAFDHAAVG